MLDTISIVLNVATMVLDIVVIVLLIKNWRKK